MADVKLQNAVYEITDDVEDEDGWIGLNSGEIFVDNGPWGHYVARWRPNATDPTFLIITATTENGTARLSVVVTVDPGNADVLVPVSNAKSPWDAG